MYDLDVKMYDVDMISFSPVKKSFFGSKNLSVQSFFLKSGSSVLVLVPRRWLFGVLVLGFRVCVVEKFSFVENYIFVDNLFL